MKRTTYNFESGGKSFTVDLTKAGDHRDLMEERIFRYGLRLFNDSANSAKARATLVAADAKALAEKNKTLYTPAAPFDVETYIGAMLERFYAGEVTGERGAPVDEVGKEFRAVLIDQAVALGNGKYNKAAVIEAIKTKGEPHVIAAVAKARKIDPADVEAEYRKVATSNVARRKSATRTEIEMEL